MPAGLLFAHLIYPDIIHVPMPTGFTLSPKGRRASIRLNRHYKVLQYSDPSNSMVAIAGKPGFFVPERDISSEFRDSRHYQIGVVPKDHFDTITKELMDGRASKGPVFHRVTFDSLPDGGDRTFETRFATDLVIGYPVNNIAALTQEDKEFCLSVIDEFVHMYRYVSDDHRPRLIEDCREPMHIEFSKVGYNEQDANRSIDAILADARELRFGEENQDKWVYDLQPNIIGLGPEEISKRIHTFLQDMDHVSPGQEFISISKHAALHTRHFKYAILETFIAAETMIVGYLRRKKIAKGVSRGKLDEWKSEVGIGYMLNVEVPLLVDNITDQDRQVLGDVDRVRKMRNDIVHEGMRPTEDDARFAVKAIEALSEAVGRWT